MARLTRKETRLLQRTSDLVRMYVALLTFVAPFLCVAYANGHYRKLAAAKVPPEIPRMATYGTITGIYLPLFAAVAAYVWATRAGPSRSLAPRGFAMALFRDAFTVLVVSVILLLPAGLYSVRVEIQSLNTLMVWYQTIITAATGAAFTYYFHNSGAPTPVADADGGEPPPPRRRPARSRPGGAGLET